MEPVFSVEQKWLSQKSFISALWLEEAFGGRGGNLGNCSSMWVVWVQSWMAFKNNTVFHALWPRNPDELKRDTWRWELTGLVETCSTEPWWEEGFLPRKTNMKPEKGPLGKNTLTSKQQTIHFLVSHVHLSGGVSRVNIGNHLGIPWFLW